MLEACAPDQRRTRKRQGGGGREEKPKLQQGKKVPLPTTLNVRLARRSRGQRVYGVCLGNEFGDKMGTNFLVSGSRVRTRTRSRDGRSAEAGETVDTCEGERTMTLETRSANKQASKGQLIMILFNGSCKSSCCTEEKCDFFTSIEHRLRGHEAQQSLNQL